MKKYIGFILITTLFAIVPFIAEGKGITMREDLTNIRTELSALDDSQINTVAIENYETTPFDMVASVAHLGIPSAFWYQVDLFKAFERLSSFYSSPFNR